MIFLLEYSFGYWFQPFHRRTSIFSCVYHQLMSCCSSSARSCFCLPLLSSIPPVSRPVLITSPPTQGKLLPYRPAVLLQHSSDKVPTTLLSLLLRGIGISMSIKANLVLWIFSHTPSLTTLSGVVHYRLRSGTCLRAAEVNNGQKVSSITARGTAKGFRQSR